MTERIRAIVAADLRIRFRRVSTVVVFLLLSACAYLWVPAPSTGRALLEVNGRRALYNSAAIGMATASLATIFIGLVGFYVISNALRRDVMTRCGFVLASTEMGSFEYLLGKFAGNVVFLSTFIAGFMVSAMGMLIVRGEAPLEPWIFAKQYLLLVPPSIAFVSAMAILFESTRLLSGRFGDVVYFFVWVASFGIVASLSEKQHSIGLLAYFDVTGFAYLFDIFHSTLHTTQLSIGSSSFDASKPVIIFEGLTLPAKWIAPRLGANLVALPMLLVARVFFHRFDPARIRVAEKTRRNWLGRLNAMTKPLARAFFTVLLGEPSVIRAAVADGMLTLGAFPIAVLAVVGFAIAAVAAPGNVTRDLLPIVFAAVGVAIAGIACREKRSGTTALVGSAPLLQPHFVAWKFASSLFVALVFLGVPLIRVAASGPRALIPLAIGILFVCAAATALGIVSANPKAFLVVFLCFWYLVTNDRGKTPSLDFAGFYGTATPAVMLAYAAITIGFLALAQVAYMQQHD